jgi:hypothetical protein
MPDVDQIVARLRALEGLEGCDAERLELMAHVVRFSQATLALRKTLSPYQSLLPSTVAVASPRRDESSG